MILFYKLIYILEELFFKCTNWNSNIKQTQDKGSLKRKAIILRSLPQGSRKISYKLWSIVICIAGGLYFTRNLTSATSAVIFNIHGSSIKLVQCMPGSRQNRITHSSKIGKVWKNTKVVVSYLIFVLWYNSFFWFLGIWRQKP